jgi:hypothetical protein
MIKAARITALLKIRGLVGFASSPNVRVRAVLHERSFESHASIEPCANFSSLVGRRRALDRAGS